MIFEWNKKYSVNVKEIDEQHKNLLRIISDLYRAIKSNKEPDILKDILSQLIDFTNTHFITEENYFDKFHYERSEEHKAAHNKLRGDVAVFVEKTKSKDADLYVLSFELIDFLEDWIVEHLELEDKKYTKCFNEHGLY
ncbi:MAG: bacteriohemerythrin [Minisyncoccota bacterium]